MDQRDDSANLGEDAAEKVHGSPREPAAPDLARAQEAWIGPAAAPGTWKLLTGTDCQIEKTAHSRPSGGGSLIAVAAGGASSSSWSTYTRKREHGRVS